MRQTLFLRHFIWDTVTSFLIECVRPSSWWSDWGTFLSCTAHPTWGVIFESSKLKARKSLLPRFSEKRRSSFELWASKQHSQMSPHMGLAVLSSLCQSEISLCQSERDAQSERSSWGSDWGTSLSSTIEKTEMLFLIECVKLCFKTLLLRHLFSHRVREAILVVEWLRHYSFFSYRKERHCSW